MSGDLELLGEQIAEQVAHLDAATRGLLANLRAFDDGGGWAHQGARSCAHWLAWRVGWGLGTAREHLRVANALGTLAQLDDELAHGRLSYSKVRAITRVATPENEAALIEQAKLSTASQLENICRKYAAVRRQADIANPEDDRERRCVRRVDLSDGMVKITAILHPEEAAMVWTAMEAAAKQAAATRLHAASDAHSGDVPAETTAVLAENVPTETTAVLAGDVPAETCAAVARNVPAETCAALAQDVPAGPGAALAGDVPAQTRAVLAGDVPAETRVAVARDRAAEPTAVLAQDVPAETRAAVAGDVPAETRAALAGDVPAERHRPLRPSAAHRVPGRPAFDRADGLVAVAQAYLRGSAAERAPVEVIVTVSQETLQRGLAADPADVASTPDGTCISAQAARRLACDVMLVEDGAGNTLSIGRKTRAVPGALKRALLARDEHRCRFPGCTNRVYLESHHIEHWATGGETALSNMISTCSFHHRFLHEYAYTVALEPDGTAVFRDDCGRVVPDAPAPASPSWLGWEAIRARNTRLAISAATNEPGWEGYPVDYGACIDVLITADGLGW